MWSDKEGEGLKSGLVCKYGAVTRLKLRQGLGRYCCFEQFDFDVIGFKHLSCELVVLMGLAP
ncbi:MAG: hypothetical protein ACKERG_02780 [Candidatus Hodgkinia cicadicola]